MEEYKIGDWVVATSNSNHHSGSKWFNKDFDFDIGKVYQIQDIEIKDCIVFKLGGSSMREHGCRKAKNHEIPLEHRKEVNILENFILF